MAKEPKKVTMTKAAFDNKNLQRRICNIVLDIKETRDVLKDLRTELQQLSKIYREHRGDQS